MEPPPPEELMQVPLPAAVLFGLIVGSGILLWLTPLRFRLHEIRGNRVPGWPARWIDFGLWLFGLYCLIYGIQVVVFMTLPAILPFPVPWDLDSGSRDATILAAGLALQLPLLAYLPLMRSYRPELFGFPLSAPEEYPTWSLLRILVAFLLLMPLVLVVNGLWQAVLLGLQELGVSINREPQELVSLIAENESPLLLFGFFLIAVLLAPVAEELIFRGGIYGFLKTRFPRWIALLLSASAFATLHANLASLVPLLFLGIALALAYEASGHIRVPILLHALFNAHQLLILLLLSGNSPL